MPARFLPSKGVGIFPTIDQAFGYGRGVHNLLRAIHSDPKKWGKLARDPVALQREIQFLIDRGLFYLTSDPAEFMRKKGLRVVADYVAHYADELAGLSSSQKRRSRRWSNMGTKMVVRLSREPLTSFVKMTLHG